MASLSRHFYLLAPSSVYVPFGKDVAELEIEWARWFKIKRNKKKNAMSLLGVYFWGF
jgi:hypothetical protein